MDSFPLGSLPLQALRQGQPVSGQARTSSLLDSPELAAAKRLLDTAKESGFRLQADRAR